jgi:hypothetical protein
MGLRENAPRNNENENAPVVKRQKVVSGKRTSVSVIHKKKQKKHNNRNLEQIFILSFDALGERQDLH